MRHSQGRALSIHQSDLDTTGPKIDAEANLAPFHAISPSDVPSGLMRCRSGASSAPHVAPPSVMIGSVIWHTRGRGGSQWKRIPVSSLWESICTVNSSNTPRSAGSGHGTACRCHPGELDAILEAAAIEDFTVSATDLSIPSTAQDCALHSRLARTLPESVAGSLTGKPVSGVRPL